MAEGSLRHDCPEPLVGIVRGNSLEVICPRCGYSAATSCFGFYSSDKTTYRLSIVSADREDRQQLGLMARIFGGTPVSISKKMKLGILPTKTGSTRSVRDDILAPRVAGMTFRVDPPYPWNQADRSLVAPPGA